MAAGFASHTSNRLHTWIAIKAAASPSAQPSYPSPPHPAARSLPTGSWVELELSTEEAPGRRGVATVILGYLRRQEGWLAGWLAGCLPLCLAAGAVGTLG